MIQKLILLISYGAALALMMPMSMNGLGSLLAVFAVGGAVILWQKEPKKYLRKSKLNWLVPGLVWMLVVFGWEFYARWMFSADMQKISRFIHIPMEILVNAAACTLAVLSSYFWYAMIQELADILVRNPQKDPYKRALQYCLIVAAATVVLTQLMNGVAIFSMGYLRYLVCVVSVLLPILLLYSLTGSLLFSWFVGGGIQMILSAISVYVYRFRGRLLEPVDVFSAGTAMNVVENYSLLPVPAEILLVWGAFGAMLAGLWWLLRKQKPELTLKRRLTLVVVCIVCAAAVMFYATGLKTYHWQKQGAQHNGYMLDLLSKIKEIRPSRPDGYDPEQIARLAEQYAAEDDSPSEYPHIIVVMDEAFADMEVIWELSTNQEVTPFISSLQENTVRGYALASVFGGNTANTEYEFLTGNSMAWLTPNTVPYQQYLRSETYSMVSYLKSEYDYHCIAMHPYFSSGWNRPAVYENLGFDEAYFMEEFPQEQYVRSYISDQETFEFLIEQYEAGKEEPLFLFCITMQNHGDYVYTGENYTHHISLTDHAGKFPEAEQYLSLIHETDKAVEQLVSYFESVEEDVIILFFGDHQPNLDEAFYAAIGGSTDTLEAQQKRFLVPFFLWANFPMEEQYVPCTSMNYLSAYVYEAAGLSLPPYSRFLQEMKAHIPVINANGFYSPEQGGFRAFEEATAQERQWLEQYKALQYNSTFDKHNRNEIFFPVLGE